MEIRLYPTSVLGNSTAKKYCDVTVVSKESFFKSLASIFRDYACFVTT